MKLQLVKLQNLLPKKIMKFNITSKLYGICLIFIGINTISISVFSQQEFKTKTNIQFLKKNADEQTKLFKKRRQQALDLAKQKSWTVERTTKQGGLIKLMGISEGGYPIYYATDNAIAAGTTRTNKLYAGGSLGLNLSGSTIPNNKIAMWDGGAVRATHQEFAGNRITIVDNVSTDLHATHVAGTIAASGVNIAAKGMAFGLPQLISYNFDNDIAEMSTAASNLILSNHSYGVLAGWVQNSNQFNRWEFLGRAGENEDYMFGYYNATSQAWDNIAFNAPYYLMVKSAGNYRASIGPSVGSFYYRYNASGVMEFAGTRPNGISSNDGYDTMGGYAVAKNILTVGAVNGLQNGPNSSSDITMAFFSAWGPTDDGRIKPDVVADGVDLLSTINSGDDKYATSTGTSMAAPNATGTLALLQELYYQRNNAYMKSATLKGLAIATATEAGTDIGPDYKFGWGLLDAERAAKTILEKDSKSIISEQTLNEGQTYTTNVTASGSGPLMATISWTDPAAVPVAEASALDNTTLRLVNDLDIRVSDGTTYLPWVLDPANPSAAATTGDNFRDNVEQIYIANAVPGKSYTITVSHKNTLQGGSQPFSLIVTGVGGNAYCSSTPASSSDSKITNFELSNINNSPSTTCTTYSDYTAQTIDLERTKTYNLSLSAGTCGAHQNKIAKVFVDWNSDGDFEDAGELAATSPVLAANGTFTSSITVPSDVVANTYARLRVVLSETTIAADVLPCGTYAKGETQDYRVKFSDIAINAGVTAIVNPVNGDAAGNLRLIRLTIKNFGASNLSAIPFTVTVKNGSTVVTTINEVFNGAINSGEEATLLVQGTFDAQPNVNYTIEAKTTLANDFVLSDDQTSKQVSFNAAPTLTDAKAYFTDVADTYYLTAGQNNAAWYSAENSTSSFIQTNASTTKTAPAAANTYYAAINEYIGSFGPATKAAFGSAGNYVQENVRLNFNVSSAMEIESARLYVGYPGAVTFDVFDSNTGVKVSSSTISVNSTRIPADPSTNADNVTDDGGQVYRVNIRFPYAGSFYVTTAFSNGATLFRNSNTSFSYGYPMIGGSGFTLSSHNAGSFFTMGNFYFYLYEIKAKPIGETTPRVAVPLSNLLITEQSGVLTSPLSNGNQWYLNGNPISNATQATYQPAQTGNYYVKVTVATDVTITSQNYSLAVLPARLKNFTANKTNNGVQLKWSVLTETNHKEYQVLRSTDRISYATIAQVLPNTSKNYTFLDKTPEMGNNYYKLLQVDLDGTSEELGLANVNYQLNNSGITVYENPAKDHVKVRASEVDTKKSYLITLSDLLGKRLKSFRVLGTSLVSGFGMDISSMASGTYLIEVRSMDGNVKIGFSKVVKL